jgi:hypothetical protein
VSLVDEISSVLDKTSFSFSKGFLKRIEFEKKTKNNEFKILSSKAPLSLLARSLGFKRTNALPLSNLGTYKYEVRYRYKCRVAFNCF